MKKPYNYIATLLVASSLATGNVVFKGRDLGIELYCLVSIACALAFAGWLEKDKPLQVELTVKKG